MKLLSSCPWSSTWRMCVANRSACFLPASPTHWHTRCVSSLHGASKTDHRPAPLDTFLTNTCSVLVRIIRWWSSSCTDESGVNPTTVNHLLRTVDISFPNIGPRADFWVVAIFVSAFCPMRCWHRFDPTAHAFVILRLYKYTNKSSNVFSCLHSTYEN